MITPSISAYLYLKQLSELKNITRKGNTTPRKQSRYDLAAMAGYWAALERVKNYKGLLFFTLIPTDKNEHRKQSSTTSEYYLQCTPAKSKSINFSGIRFMYEDGKVPLYGSGEPSDQPKFKGGIVNPMYEQRNDGFLFLFSKDMETLEVLIVESGRLLIDAYRKQLSVGGLNDILETLRKQAKEVTPYSKL